MPSVCAIVPTYNRLPLLREALAGIRSQTRPVDQIVVVDDGSTDGTAEAIARLPDPPTLLRLDNGGKARALNAGLAACRCEAVWICDDDDVALPHAAQALAGALERTGADFAFGAYERFRTDATGDRAPLPRGYWPDLAGRSLFAALAEDFFLFQNATLVRASAYRRVGPFREDLVRSQDYDMALRLARACEGVHVDRPVFLQRDHDAARGTSRLRIEPAEVVARWIAADAEIMARLCDEAPLDVFAREHVAQPAPLRRRAALLQRACALARRKLWERALADLAEAVATQGPGPLTEREAAICGRVLLSKYGCDELLADPGPLRGLARLRAGGGLGAEVAAAVARPLLWRAREAAEGGRAGAASRFLGAFVALSGPREAARALARRIVERAGARVEVERAGARVEPGLRRTAPRS